MPAIVRYDEQHCPIARALDVLGDRWTLLILRELVIGDQRYTDLAAHLPGIAPTLLSQRLRTMIDQGLVTTKELPPPAARSVYTVTAHGRKAISVLRALTRFGMPLLEQPDDEVVVRPWTAAHAAVGAFFQPLAAIGIDERYLLRIDGEEFTLSSVPGGGAPHDKPDLVLEGPARGVSRRASGSYVDSRGDRHRPPCQARLGEGTHQLHAHISTGRSGERAASEMTSNDGRGLLLRYLDAQRRHREVPGSRPLLRARTRPVRSRRLRHLVRDR